MTPDERQQLVMRNLPLVRAAVLRLAGRCVGTPDAFDDLVQEGSIGLMEAAQLFDPDRGTKFSTWAWYRVRAHVQRAMRRWADVPLPSGDMEGLSDPEGDPGELLDAGEARRELDAALDLLPPRSAHVLRGRVVDGRTLEDLGRELGVCKERVRQIEQRALAWVLDHFPRLAELC